MLIRKYLDPQVSSLSCISVSQMQFETPPVPEKHL